MYQDFDKEPLLSRWLTIILFIAYFIVWLVPRYESIDENVRFFDDYLRVSEGRPEIVDPCRFPAKDYRWIFDAGMCFAEEHVPEFLESSGPKLLAGSGLALFAVILCLCMRSWRFPIVVSITAPILFLSHPTVNDVSLWNIVGPGGLVIALCGYCYLLLEHRQSSFGVLAAISLLLIVLFTAELYLIIFLLLAVSELGARASSGLGLSFIESMKKCSIFCLLAIFYLVSRWAAEAWFGSENIIARGMVSGLSMNEYISLKYQAVTNVLSNVYATPLSQFFSLEFALASWKWVIVIVLSSIGFVAYGRTRSAPQSLLFIAFAGAIMLLPTAPVLATDQNPTAWRIAVPSVLALVIVISVGQNMVISKRTNSRGVFGGRFAVVLIFAFNIGLASLWAVSSKAESDLRASEFRMENQFLSDIKVLNKFNNRASVLLEIDGQAQINGAESLRASQLNVAYVHRGLYLSLDTAFSWRGKLRDHGFEPVELVAQPKAKYSQLVVELCETSSILDCRLGNEAKALDHCREMPMLVEPTLGLQASYFEPLELSVICRLR